MNDKDEEIVNKIIAAIAEKFPIVDDKLGDRYSEMRVARSRRGGTAHILRGLNLTNARLGIHSPADGYRTLRHADGRNNQFNQGDIIQAYKRSLLKPGVIRIDWVEAKFEFIPDQE